MLLQTNSYIVPKDKRGEHARLMRRFRALLNKLGCDQFEVYEQAGANWAPPSETNGRFVQIMRFRDRKHQAAVQNAERSDTAAQALISEFCDLVNFPYQQQQGFFAVGFYISSLPNASSKALTDDTDASQTEADFQDNADAEPVMEEVIEPAAPEEPAPMRMSAPEPSYAAAPVPLEQPLSQPIHQEPAPHDFEAISEPVQHEEHAIPDIVSEELLEEDTHHSTATQPPAALAATEHGAESYPAEPQELELEPAAVHEVQEHHPIEYGQPAGHGHHDLDAELPDFMDGSELAMPSAEELNNELSAPEPIAPPPPPPPPEPEAPVRRGLFRRKR